uniref:Uncharacterized protein n=1 Tax=Cacopsylla melanoneura TaxID=428564 RepID=A0A8D8RD35_9HEMI
MGNEIIQDDSMSIYQQIKIGLILEDYRPKLRDELLDGVINFKFFQGTSRVLKFQILELKENAFTEWIKALWSITFGSLTLRSLGQWGFFFKYNIIFVRIEN